MSHDFVPMPAPGIAGHPAHGSGPRPARPADDLLSPATAMARSRCTCATSTG